MSRQSIHKHTLSGNRAQISDDHADQQATRRQPQRKDNAMKHTLLRTSSVVTLLLLALAGCGAPGPTTTDSLPVHVVYADLASGVTSLDELATVGQLAVLATAKDSTQEANPADPTLVATIQSFTIDKPIWGTAAGDVVKVKFTGGVVDDKAAGRYMLQVDGQPQFKQGQQYFLVLLGPSPDGTYMVLGGPQGRYDIAAGRLAAVPGTQADPVIAALDGREAETATQDLARRAGPK